LKKWNKNGSEPILTLFLDLSNNSSTNSGLVENFYPFNQGIISLPGIAGYE